MLVSIQYIWTNPHTLQEAPKRGEANTMTGDAQVTRLAEWTFAGKPKYCDLYIVSGFLQSQNKTYPLLYNFIWLLEPSPKYGQHTGYQADTMKCACVVSMLV